jgi:hypothetical protein
VWVEAPAEERLRRGLARDGERLRAQWLRWEELEAAVFAAEWTRERADLCGDGAPAVPDPAGHVTVGRTMEP